VAVRKPDVKILFVYLSILLVYKILLVYSTCLQNSTCLFYLSTKFYLSILLVCKILLVYSTCLKWSWHDCTTHNKVTVTHLSRRCVERLICESLGHLSHHWVSSIAMVVTIDPNDWCELGLHFVGFDTRRQKCHKTNLERFAYSFVSPDIGISRRYPSETGHDANL
jgi:hypothetical protein